MTERRQKHCDDTVDSSQRFSFYSPFYNRNNDLEFLITLLELRADMWVCYGLRIDQTRGSRRLFCVYIFPVGTRYCGRLHKR